VKSIRYERLYSFEKYSNERIGLEIEIAEGEDEKQGFAYALDLIHRIHLTFEVLRKLVELRGVFNRRIDKKLDELQEEKTRLSELMIKERVLKAEMDKLVKAYEKDESVVDKLAKVRCELPDLMDRIKNQKHYVEKIEEEIKNINEELKKINSEIESIRNNLRNGALLDEDEAEKRIIELDKKLGKYYY
jgi:chromosome segregation ATPase